MGGRAVTSTWETLPGGALKEQVPGSRWRVLTWALWDWGTQPFATVITTFVFAVYITSPAFGDTNTTSVALSTSTLIGGVAVAALAPVLGQHADRGGSSVTTLRVLTWALTVLSAALYLVRPHPSYVWLGLALLAVGSIVRDIADVSYNSTIDQVASAGNVGRVSGLGWGLGYLGGIFSLLLVYFAFIQPEVGLFGVASTEALDIRVSMLVCAVWMALFTIPPLVMLRNSPPRDQERLGVVGSYQALITTVRRLWRTERQLVYFLLASALFRDGLNAVFTFGAVIAAGTFGFSSGEVIVFGAVASVVAGVATMACGVLDDRLGPQRVILFSLAALVVLATGIFLLHDRGRTAFWALGLGMTAFVGPAQSAARSYLARLIPEGKSAELFGLYATTGRVVSFIAPAAFGGGILLGATVTGQENTQYWGILGVALVLAAGLAVMLAVVRSGQEELGTDGVLDPETAATGRGGQ